MGCDQQFLSEIKLSIIENIVFIALNKVLKELGSCHSTLIEKIRKPTEIHQLLRFIQELD